MKRGDWMNKNILVVMGAILTFSLSVTGVYALITREKRSTGKSSSAAYEVKLSTGTLPKKIAEQLISLKRERIRTAIELAREEIKLDLAKEENKSKGSKSKEGREHIKELAGKLEELKEIQGKLHYGKSSSKEEADLEDNFITSKLEFFDRFSDKMMQQREKEAQEREEFEKSFNKENPKKHKRDRYSDASSDSSSESDDRERYSGSDDDSDTASASSDEDDDERTSGSSDDSSESSDDERGELRGKLKHVTSPEAALKAFVEEQDGEKIAKNEKVIAVRGKSGGWVYKRVKKSKDGLDVTDKYYKARKKLQKAEKKAARRAEEAAEEGGREADVSPIANWVDDTASARGGLRGEVVAAVPLYSSPEIPGALDQAKRVATEAWHKVERHIGLDSEGAWEAFRQKDPRYLSDEQRQRLEIGLIAEKRFKISDAKMEGPYLQDTINYNLLVNSSLGHLFQIPPGKKIVKVLLDSEWQYYIVDVSVNLDAAQFTDITKEYNTVLVAYRQQAAPIPPQTATGSIQFPSSLTP